MFCKHLLVYMIGIFHCLLIVLKNTVPSPIILIDVIERALSFKIPEKSRTLLILPQNQNIQNSESSVYLHMIYFACMGFHFLGNFRNCQPLLNVDVMLPISYHI
jgi:hypothetical protein